MLTCLEDLKSTTESLLFLYLQSSQRISELGVSDISEGKAFISSYMWEAPLSRPCTLGFGERLNQPEKEGIPSEPCKLVWPIALETVQPVDTN